MVGKEPITGKWYVWHKVRFGLRKERLRVFIRRMLRANNIKAADEALYTAQRKGFTGSIDVGSNEC